MMENNHNTIKMCEIVNLIKKFYIKFDNKSAVESVKHENNMGKKLLGFEPKLESPK